MENKDTNSTERRRNRLCRTCFGTVYSLFFVIGWQRYCKLPNKTKTGRLQEDGPLSHLDLIKLEVEDHEQLASHVQCSEIEFTVGGADKFSVCLNLI